MYIYIVIVRPYYTAVAYVWASLSMIVTPSTFVYTLSLDKRDITFVNRLTH